MLHPVSIAGLLVTGTDTGVGKTVVAGGIARWFRRSGHRVAVCKPCGSGCVSRREGLVSEDAEFLAHCADSPHPLDVVCPQRYAEPLAPAVAAQRAGKPLDWTIIDRCIRDMSSGSDCLIVEGIGGILVPMDERFTMLDVAAWLRLPAVVVARAGLGTINHTLLTIAALRGAGVRLAGVVINRYPAESPGVAEETNPRIIERWGKTSVLAMVPDCPQMTGPNLPEDVTGELAKVDWSMLAQGRSASGMPL